MKQTDEKYNRIVSGEHHFEVSLVIGNGYPNSGYREDSIREMFTDRKVFGDGESDVGSVFTGEIEVTMLKPGTAIPKNARLRPYFRAVNATEKSSWYQKGEFYVDTREEDKSGQNIVLLVLHGYDVLRLAEGDFYPDDNSAEVTGTDLEIIQYIARSLGVSVEDGTKKRLSGSFIGTVPKDEYYSMREVLSFVAAAYAGAFIISDEGQLQLIQLNELPAPARYLATSGAYRRLITIGGRRIRV